MGDLRLRPARAAHRRAAVRLTQVVTSAFDERDSERLQALLAEGPRRDRAMRIDALQGLCVALAMGPDAETSNRWLDVALGEHDERSEVDPELAGLLQRFSISVEDALSEGTLAIRPRETRTGRRDYTDWCRGFLDGVELSETDWFAAADPEELAELLFPIEVLADALPAHERAAYNRNAWRNAVMDAEASLPVTISRLRDYWSIVRAPPATIRRDQPKTGRNDPCPCGSGKKFKQCHGRA